ncbi:hypothetical protein HYS54_02725 [Candidatus Micrarchaeota archaeon]|nr:hypothetical protein [Candidatus Micrarchaeota archaeon]
MTLREIGVNAERQWKKILERTGQIVTRAPGSGIAPECFYDLMSFDQTGRGYLWEIKSTKHSTKYFHENELENITRLALAHKTHNVFSFLVILYRTAGRFKVYRPTQALKYKKIAFKDKGETWFAPQYGAYRKTREQPATASSPEAPQV